MQSDFKVGRCSRRCYLLDRPFRDGEWYYSVVSEAGDEYIRRDYAAEAWTGPPEGAVGWWKSRMPARDDRKLVLAPKELLLDLLRQMGDFPHKAKSRYLLALLLLRRRIVRVASDAPADPAATPTPPFTDPLADEAGADHLPATSTLRLEAIGDGGLLEIPICEISRSEAEALREELNELIYCEATPEP